MATKIRKVLDNIEASIYNPNLMQDAVLDTLLEINDGNNIEILDVNNPVAFSIEASATMAQASIEFQQYNLRRRNAVMAVEFEDLYGHMSDKDFIDPFAQPDYCDFILYLGKAEILAKAMPLVSDGTRKLIIPKDTELYISGYTFTLQYNIEIRVMAHGGLQIVYDTSEASPVKDLSTNTLDWNITTVPYEGKSIDTVQITIPAMQYKINSFADTLTSGISWKNVYSFNDQFFYARVWLRKSLKWVEINTTHSNEVLDVTNVTAQLTVGDGKVEVYIPDIYIRNGLASGDIRVDIYSTKGALGINLSTYNVGEFTSTFKEISGELDTQYYTPFKTFSQISLLSADSTTGGRSALTFAELRDRVIDNSVGSRSLPISELQLGTTLSDLGFEMSKSIDYVTERIYLATASMPDSTIEGLSTPIGTVNGQLETSWSVLSDLDTVNVNGNRLTILPTTLYQYDQGEITVDTNSLADYMRRTSNSIATMVNEGTFLYTPFHYVLDVNDDVFEARAYYLASPSISNKRFVETNATLVLDVSTASQSIVATDTGYNLILKTRSGDTYKSLTDDQRHAQISFTPRGYNEEYAYLDGTLLGKDSSGELIWQFAIESNLDIDKNHDIIVNNFILTGDKATDISMKLDVAMNVIYSVSKYNPSTYSMSYIDDINTSNDVTNKAVTYEILTLDVGEYLDALWTNARTIAGSINYQRYTEDVMAYYSENIYDRFESTKSIKYEIVNDADGKPVVNWVVKHAKGDPILINGVHQKLHEEGGVIYNEDGTPKILAARTIKRRIDLFLLDAKFLFSQHEDTVSYMADVTSKLLSYITNDIPSVDTSLLEKTSLYFYPKTTMGLIDVLLGDGTTDRFDAENKFSVRYYLTNSARSNTEFLETLGETTRSAILANLNGSTVSTSAITSEIRNRMGDEIVDVEMDGMGDDHDQLLFTVTDEGHYPVIGKKLVVNADYSLSVADDISIGYNKHVVS